MGSVLEIPSSGGVAMIEVRPDHAKVTCHKLGGMGGGGFASYVYDGDLKGACIARYYEKSGTREGALKKLALRIFRDLRWAEQKIEELQKGRKRALSSRKR